MPVPKSRSETVQDFQVDVLVVGAGNAAACAALAAREKGASVAMLEAAPQEERGGNSTYTAGAMRVVFHGVDDLAQLYDLTDEEKRDVDFGSYSADQFLDDMGRVTNYRCDPELTDILIGRSFETLKWMRSKGVRFQPSYGRQAFKVNGKYKFWGGLAVEAWGGGPGLVDRRAQIADEGDAHAQLAFQPDVIRRRVRDDEERWRSRLVGAIPHLLVPAVGAVDSVEQPPPHHDRAARARRLHENLGVDRVLLHHPRVDFRRIAEAVLLVGALARHEPVERHRDVGDHLRHVGLLRAASASSDRRTPRDSSPNKRSSTSARSRAETTSARTS